MTTDTWLAISAAATFLLAGAAFWAIMDNRHGRIVEQRQRLLNEIIEWALDAAKAAVSRQKMTKDELWKTKLKYKYSKAKSKYIIEVASPSFKNLLPFVKKVITKLDKAIKATTEFIENKQRSGDKLVYYEDELTESVKNLITEAAKIKTKDIS